MEQNSKKEMFVIALKLLVICSIVAVIVAFVNSITKERIAYNEKLDTADALTGIYSSDYDGKAFEVSENSFVIKNDGNLIVKASVAQCSYISDDITALYVLENADGSTAGFCVAIEPMGMKDVIKMLVAVNADQTVKGVKIVSMSETSGIGTKATDEKWFLEQFVGHGAEIPQSNEIKIISGATKTTKPIINAVGKASEQVGAYVSSLGGERNE